MMKAILPVLFFMGCLIALSIDDGWGNSLSPQEEPWLAPAWTDTLSNPFSSDPEAVARGKENYDVYCWSCHGKKGRGDGAAGVSFPVKPADFRVQAVRGQSDGALYWKLTNGRGNMTAYQDLLSDEQRWELVSYIRVLSNDANE
ncbi:MAG TPA: cytochrome c [Cyclobacteriaceae bacterium]